MREVASLELESRMYRQAARSPVAVAATAAPAEAGTAETV
jgi:hypothetical protein